MSISNRVILVNALATCLGIQAASYQVDAANFTLLGYLPGASHDEESSAIAADGSVVVGNETGGDGYLGFRWTAASGILPLGDLPGGLNKSGGSALSADGSIVVGQSDANNGLEAFRWTAASGLEGLGDLPGGAYYSFARGVSGDGSIVVGGSRSTNSAISSPFTFEAFRWTRLDGMVPLGDLPAGVFNSNATAISADGSVIVGNGGSAVGQEAFRWTSAGGMVGLGGLPGGSGTSFANAVSYDGSVIVGFADEHPFRWTQADGMKKLSGSGEITGRALALSADGSTIVGQDEVLNAAFIWDAVHGERKIADILAADGIELGDSTLFGATGISADGTLITGVATNSANEYEAFIADLTPGFGDYNHNSTVDASDYVLWRKGLGTIYTQNGYNVWRAYFGQILGSGAGVNANAAVPEPATAMMLILAAAGWCLCRGRAA